MANVVFVPMDPEEIASYGALVTECCVAVQRMLEPAGYSPMACVDVAAALIAGVERMFPELQREQILEAMILALEHQGSQAATLQ